MVNYQIFKDRDPNKARDKMQWKPSSSYDVNIHLNKHVIASLFLLKRLGISLLHMLRVKTTR